MPVLFLEGAGKIFFIGKSAGKGYLHTTWHTLSKGFRYVLLADVGGFENLDGYDRLAAAANAASLLRKVLPCEVFEKMIFSYQK